ncbi:transposase [Streptomyces sp. NPDC005393]|uniref:transposase n=1 Tax=Streptomyces sp. NPDC005393 TaxID=3157041 RepID=UPI0033A018F3
MRGTHDHAGKVGDRVQGGAEVQVLVRLVEGVLADGSYLARIHADKANKATGTVKAPPAPVWVVEYRIDGQAEVIRLITSLMDHEKYPAAELAERYARRWEIELVFDEIKTHQRDRPILRSQTPDGIRQEIFAHLVVHHATRGPARRGRPHRSVRGGTDLVHPGPERHPPLGNCTDRLFPPRHANVTVASASLRSPEPCCPDDGHETARRSSNRASPRAAAEPPTNPPASTGQPSRSP